MIGLSRINGSIESDPIGTLIDSNREYKSNWRDGSNRIPGAGIGSRKRSGSIESDPIGTALKAMGVEGVGVWCLSRGLARQSADYKAMLARADQVRQGDLDGRGQLSEQALITFCDFMLDTAIYQVDYISDLLMLDQMRDRIEHYIHARNEGRVPGYGSIKEIAGAVLYNAFISGRLDRSRALELCAMPERSARRVLSQLKEEGLLGESSRLSPLSWEIPEHAEPWYFPQLRPGI